MTKKNAGIQKSEVIRIHKNDRLDLNFIKGEIGMSLSRYKEGDVVHELIQMYKSKKIKNESKSGVQSVSDSDLQLTLDHYKGKYEYAKTAAKYWQDNFRIACETGKLDPKEIMQPIPVKNNG